MISFIIACNNDENRIVSIEKYQQSIAESDLVLISSYGQMHNDILHEYIISTDTSDVDDFVFNWILTNANFDDTVIVFISNIDLLNYFTISDFYNYVQNSNASSFVISKTIEYLDISYNDDLDFNETITSYNNLFNDIVFSTVDLEEKYAILVPLSIAIKSLEYWDDYIANEPSLTWEDARRIGREDLKGATWAVLASYTSCLIKSDGNPKVFLALIAGSAVLGAAQSSIEEYLKLPMN